MKNSFSLLIVPMLLACFLASQVAAAEKVDLKCYSYGIEKHDASLGTRMLLDRVKERWKGQLDYKIFYADTIIKTKQALDAISAGVVDTVTATTSYFTGKVPIGDAYLMPFAFKSKEKLLEFAQNQEVIDIMNKYYGKAANAKVIAFLCLGEAQIMSKGKPIEKLEDFKGRKMRSAGGFQGEFIQSLGASPVTIPSSEVYLALQRGIVDSANWAAWTIGKLKMYEVLDNVILHPPFQSYGVPIFINKDKWESLPEDLQKVFNETAREVERDFLQITQKAQDEGIKAGKEHGMKFIDFSPEETQKFISAVKPVYDKWAEKNGLDAERLLQLMGVR